ncbi:MAG TPA: hypothetical protein VLA93_21530 [Pyrinomonadaceae bacterium]|nr:hypothetical protein [Pyrinomonadaceae bacterium]
MTTTRTKVKTTIVVLLVYSILQIGVQLAFAQPLAPITKVAIPQQLVGRLTTKNNRPITVNGLSASSGAAIASGATIETKADESATIELGPLGRLEVAPNTKVVLTFDETGAVKALVLNGCVTLIGNKGTKGEVATESATVGTTDPVVGGTVANCPTPAPPPGGSGGGGGGGGLFGIGTAATVAVFAGYGFEVLAPILFLQDNPSPS